MPIHAHHKPILKAAKTGDAAAVRMMLEADATLVDARDADGSTPLHCASWKGHVDVVNVLLDFGADVNAKSENDHYGDTPLDAAAHGNQRAVVEALIARGADVQSTNPFGRTPIQETEAHNATAAAKVLRQHGA